MASRSRTLTASLHCQRMPARPECGHQDDGRGQGGRGRMPVAPAPGPLPQRDRPGHDRLAGEEPPQVVGQRGGRGVALARLLLQALQAIVSRSRGRPGTSRDGGTGSAFMTCSRVSSAVAPRNGGRPVSSSYRIAPRA